MSKKCRLFLVPVCLRMDMYQAEWRAAISEGYRIGRTQKSDFLLGWRFLGLPFLMATFNTLATVVVFLSPSWMLDSPWWQVVFYWGLLTKSVRKQMLVLFFYYSLLGSIGQGYELLHASRKIRFMRFLGPAGESNLTQDEVVRFRRFTRNILRYLHRFFAVHLTLSMVTFYASAFMSGAWEFNRFWMFFWLTFWIIYFPSSFYVPMAMPTLLCIVVHYLRLIQKRLEVVTIRYDTTRFVSVITCYTNFVRRYIAFNRQLTEISHFWAFHLWLYMTILPLMIVYLTHVATIARQLEWIFFGILASLIFASLLGMIVYLCNSVRQGNRRISSGLAVIYRRRIEHRLVGDLGLHLRLESMLHNIILTDYSFQTTNHQVIGTGTYFSLLAKFAFVYFKVLSNKNFNSQT